MSRAFFLASLLLPLSALAEPAPECVGLEDLHERIRFCTDNRLAVQAAQHCAAALRSRWDRAPGALGQLLSNAKRSRDPAGQRLEFANSHTDLEKTVDQLDDLIELTQDSTALLARYPEIMYDAEGLRRPEQSLKCFYEPFNQLQELVSQLDDKILEGLHARAESERMRQVALARDHQVGATSVPGAPARSLASTHAAGSARVPSGPAARAGSSITGVDQAERKRALTETVLRGK